MYGPVALSHNTRADYHKKSESQKNWFEMVFFVDNMNNIMVKKLYYLLELF